jgi:hypothetical protein
MNEVRLKVHDWASDVAEKLIGDIPQTMPGRWASDTMDAVSDMLREQLAARASRGSQNTSVEQVVRGLPEYLPEHVTARLRAKMLGALLTAGALGEHMRDAKTTADVPSSAS